MNSDVMRKAKFIDRITARAKRKGTNLDMRKEGWFRYNEFYDRSGQPYHTFAFKAPNEISKAIDSVAETPEKIFAVEFGPGRNTFIDRRPFKRRLFVDYSELMLASLEFSLTGNRTVLESSEKIHLDIRNVRKIGKRFGRFGLSVANEVLTHIPPEQRMSVVDSLAEKSDRIVLTDRYGYVPGIAIANTGKVEAEYVDHKAIAGRLVQKGFEVKVWLYPHKKTPFPESYFVISAKKSKAPRIIETAEKTINR